MSDLEADLLLLAGHASRWSLFNRAPGKRDWTMVVMKSLSDPTRTTDQWHRIEKSSFIDLITDTADWFRNNP